jgi:hypothetical protein
MIDIEELIAQLLVVAYDDIAPIRRAQILHVVAFLEAWSKDHKIKAN